MRTIRSAHSRGSGCVDTTRARPSVRATHVPPAQSSTGGETPTPSVINEDVLARLKAAEAEAAKLRQQLELAQAAKGAPAPDALEAKPQRIDSTDNRETPFNKSERSAWLSEADVTLFLGGAAVGEVPGDAPKDPEAEAVVQRRLLIGGLLTAGAAAFALIPTEFLRPRPSKPLYFYLIPLLRIQDLLQECQQVIDDAQWGQLRLVLTRVMGPPNNVRENLDSVVALIDDSGKRAKAQKLAFELAEYLDAMDYNKYFDAMPTRVISGAQNAEFVKFSTQALKSAQSKLGQFLQLVPSDELQIAFEQSRMY